MQPYKPFKSKPKTTFGYLMRNILCVNTLVFSIFKRRQAASFHENGLL